MWLIRLTPSAEAISRGALTTIQTIPSDDAEDLLKHPSGNWKWDTIDRLLDEGLLTRVEVDFVPTSPTMRERAIIDRMGR